MDKKVLVPLDGSELAEIALPYAEELAVKLGLGIELLRAVTLAVYVEPVGVTYTAEHRVAAESGARLYLEKTRSRFKKKGIDVKNNVVCNAAADGIIDRAAKDDIGLVVLATHGHSGISRWALGSVANKVIRGTEKPVMLVRAKEVYPALTDRGILRKMLVPLDGSPASEAVFPHVAWLASGLGAEVVLFQALAGGYHTIAATGYEYAVYPEQQMASDKAFAEDYLSGIRKQLKEKGVTSKIEVRSGDAAEEIIELANEAKADMVAMSTHGRSGVGRWLFGSVAERVLHEGNKPLLLVRSPGAKVR